MLLSWLIIAVLISTCLTLFVTIIIQRLILHSLSHLPGPKLAAVTYWYDTYYNVIKKGRYIFRINDLHKVYGPVMRITPREVHINDPLFLDQVYPSSPLRKRDKDANRSLDAANSVGGTVSHDLHRARKEALNPYFSQKAVFKLEDNLKAKVMQLLKQIQNEAAKSEGIVNMSDAFYAFARDIVFQCCFGRDEDQLSDLAKASQMRENLTGLLRGSHIKASLPWLFTFAKFAPMGLRERLTPAGIRDMVTFSQSISQEMAKVMSAHPEQEPETQSIFQDMYHNTHLPLSEKSCDRLEREATLLMMAGTESTAKSMAIAQFYLIQDKDVMQKLRAELSQHPSSTLAELKQLSYLSAMIQEANRLSFGITGRNTRIAPTETLSYKGCIIPAGTPVSISSLAVHTNERLFPDPWAFKPERWLGDDGKGLRKYQMAFGKGPRSCIGATLAWAELAMVISSLARRFDLQLYETDEDDVKFLHDFHVSHPKLGSKGVKVKVLRMHK